MRMRKAIRWFVSLVQRDMELFEVDAGRKERTYQQVRYKKRKITENQSEEP